MGPSEEKIVSEFFRCILKIFNFSRYWVYCTIIDDLWITHLRLSINKTPSVTAKKPAQLPKPVARVVTSRPICLSDLSDFDTLTFTSAPPHHDQTVASRSKTLKHQKPLGSGFLSSLLNTPRRTHIFSTASAISSQFFCFLLKLPQWHRLLTSGHYYVITHDFNHLPLKIVLPLFDNSVLLLSTSATDISITDHSYRKIRHLNGDQERISLLNAINTSEF